MGLLALPVLVALAWLAAGLLWWDRRHGVITAAQRPWTLSGFVLLALAMALAMAAVPGTGLDQLARGAVLAVSLYGVWYLRRPHRDGS